MKVTIELDAPNPFATAAILTFAAVITEHADEIDTPDLTRMLSKFLGSTSRLPMFEDGKDGDYKAFQGHIIDAIDDLHRWENGGGGTR